MGDHGTPYIEVLRLGHRPERDKRITTHVSLVARAFGAKGIHIDRSDPKLEGTIHKVNEQFGGDFFIDTGASRKGVMRRWNGTIVHLTMYGMSLDEAVAEIPDNERILVVVGAEKVPRDVYDLAHFNVSVANQPHSEVSALALFLDRMFKGEELSKNTSGGTMNIEPNRYGKTVVPKGGDVSEVSDPFDRKWSTIPDQDECIDLLRALGCSQPVITHVKSVRDLGMEIIKRSKVDLKDDVVDPGLLEAGLLLHDIGRSISHSMNHITYGVEIARRLELDERIVKMVHNHIGAGITASEAVGLGLPNEDHIPLTLMEKIVCHSDTLVGDRRRRSLDEAVTKLRDKGAMDAAERMISLHHELEQLFDIDIDELL